MELKTPREELDRAIKALRVITTDNLTSKDEDRLFEAISRTSAVRDALNVME
jgi:hypothetical protein